MDRRYFYRERGSERWLDVFILQPAYAFVFRLGGGTFERVGNRVDCFDLAALAFGGGTARSVRALGAVRAVPYLRGLDS